MSEIKGPGRIGASSIVGPAAADTVAAPQAASEAAAAAVTTDPVVALFEAVQARFPEGIHGDRAAVVRAVVDDVLLRGMGDLAAATRDGVAQQVTDALLSHPELSARLDRLLTPKA